MRFEKVSLEQFKKDWTKYVLKRVVDDKDLFSTFIAMDGTNLDYSILSNEKFVENIYQDIELPKRGTKGSAGYDFYMPLKFRLAGYEEKSISIPTGIRCHMDNNQYLMLCPRSGLGCKGLGLVNTIGIIDSDYYNADNEGHILVSLNNSIYKEIIISSGQGFVQGIVQNYCVAENDKVQIERKGGFGSTDVKVNIPNQKIKKTDYKIPFSSLMVAIEDDPNYTIEEKLFVYKEMIEELGGCLNDCI